MVLIVQFCLNHDQRDFKFLKRQGSFDSNVDGFLDEVNHEMIYYKKTLTVLLKSTNTDSGDLISGEEGNRNRQWVFVRFYAVLRAELRRGRCVRIAGSRRNKRHDSDAAKDPRDQKEPGKWCGAGARIFC